MTANHARATGQAETWTGWQKCLAAVLVVLGLGITVIAFVLLYGTITSLLQPYMGSRARAVPICGEIAFAFLFANGVLLASRRAPSGILRGFLMAALAIGSLILNVWASRHVLPSAVGHVVVVVAFFGVMLAGKSTIMILRGGKVRADAITAGEWIAHPLRSAELWRWMKAWGEPSRSAAQADYMVLLYARAIAQADPRIGRRLRWQHRLPVTLRYELSTGMLPDGLDAGDWQQAVREHVEKQLDLLHREQPESIPDRTPQGTADGKPEVTGQGTRQVTAKGKSGGSREGSDWPETRDVNKAVLRRRVKAACERYEAASEGRHLPATQLSSLLKVRMSRETATSLLRQAYGTDGGKRNEGTG